MNWNNVDGSALGWEFGTYQSDLKARGRVHSLGPGPELSSLVGQRDSRNLG